MKRTTSIVLFASVFAVAVGTLGLSGNSATLLMASAVPQAQEPIGMLGHVEYKVLDSSGNIVQYMQNDNIVVNDGEDCSADAIFGAGTCAGAIGTNYFDHISIGNGSSANVGATNSTLADATDDTTGTCASTGVGGDMARKQVTPTHTPASGATGAIVTLDTSSAPFTFDASNATTVIDSGVFNADYGTPNDQGTCGGVNTAGTTWDMFSRQLLNAATGITVNDGDSLSVKWTITVG
jgi:hypothetical protein